MAFHLLFEQSGTFKNELKKLGQEAYDYDILNDFQQTDFQIDLYDEIECAYKRERETVFDRFTPSDQLIAFFPCVRFENQIQLYFRGDAIGQKKWSDVEKLEYDLNLHEELHKNYTLITEMVIVCIQRHLKLIIENPYSTTHYLTKYWCIKPKVIDYNRRERGDYFMKPTQFWFINCEPKNNFIMEAKSVVPFLDVGHTRGATRSLLSPQYANRFLREFVLDENRREHEFK